MLAAVLPGQLFELLLELQPGQLAPFRTQVLEIRRPHLVTMPGWQRVTCGRWATMPLTTDCAASVMAGTMNPPGHMQNE